MVAGTKPQGLGRPAVAQPEVERRPELDPAAVNRSLFYGAPATTRKGRECVLKVLEATKTVLILEGYSGLTLRQVARRADIAHSNVQYYFPTKDKLVHGFILYICDSYSGEIVSLLDQAPPDSLAQFRALIRYYIADDRKVAVNAIFFELRAMSQRSDFILQALDAMYTDYRRRLEALLAAVNPRLEATECALRAALIVSLIDGLMVFVNDRQPRHPELDSLGEAAERETVRLATMP